jgi:Holliday junction DNA helicase RuvA
MIGYIEGEVIFSDGHETIIKTADGLGRQIHYGRILPEGARATLFLSQIIREDAQELYGFSNLRDKKLFELLLTVKGVGPKSAFSLATSLGVEQIITAVQFEAKSTLSKAPGIGPKAAAQIILDLTGKVERIRMYTEGLQSSPGVDQLALGPIQTQQVQVDTSLLSEAIMACKELGFKEQEILPLARRILSESQVQKAEQLVHLVLKEL